MSIRVLFVGEDWHGSNATSFKRSLRFLGCDVLNVNEREFYPDWSSFYLKVLRMLLRRIICVEFNRYLRREAAFFRPDIVFVFKGSMVRRDTLMFFHDIGALTFNFYPDVDLVSHSRRFCNDFLACVPHYDCVFTPKAYHLVPLARAGARRVEFLPYAYDPWCHFPADLRPDEAARFRSDVVFVGIWEARRAAILEQLVGDGVNFSLAVWGDRWNQLDVESPLRRYVKFRGVTGQSMGKVFAASRIALAFLTPPDLHTARTFEIPAYGAFMLAERTSEHITFFKEGQEIACFGSVEELKEKIEYYLEHDDERRRIAAAGYRKVTQGGHSYIDRMKRVLGVYRQLVEG